MTPIPAAYRDGAAKASRSDPELAAVYLRHTLIGDPDADALLRELGSDPRGQGWVQRGIEQGPDALAGAPAAVREFFARIEEPPTWFDPEKAIPGCRAFHRHAGMFLAAFVGAVLVEGFATTIARSFSITGRLVDQGVRRLKQNNRHLVEIFLPGGLERHGDGWKLSVRIRLVHARVRQLLLGSRDWDTATWGVPIHSANMGYATAVFSALLLQRAARLGVRLTAEERESFMMIWRYAGLLMGVAPELSCATEAEALGLHRVGTLCGAPGVESIQLANALIHAAPQVAGIEDPEESRRTVKLIYRVSRSLIGDEMADALRYPAYHSMGALAMLRWTHRLDQWLRRLLPSVGNARRAGDLQKLLDLSFYGQEGLRYRLPGHLYAEQDYAGKHYAGPGEDQNL